MRTTIFAIIVQLIPLAFLLLASITCPTLSNIYLAKDSKDTIYGIFGYCTSNSKCTPISLHTDFASSISSSLLSSDVINKMAPSLVIAPVSAGLTFLSCIFNIFSVVFHSKLDFSTIYWSFVILISLLAFLSSAFICIISFLLFYPHVSWLTWCLIPSAVLNFVVMIIDCISYKLLPSSNDLIDDTDYHDYDEKTTSDFDPSNNIFGKSKLDIDMPENIPQLKSTYIPASSTSSLKEKNDFLIETKKVDTNNSSLSLKLPNVSNPYIDNNETILNAEGIDNIENNDIDDRITHSEQSSENSENSNFTSISQRPINPNYYAGASTKPRLPLASGSAPNQYNVNPQLNKNFNHQMNFQQRQINQYQNQISSMPTQNRNVYMNKPKPYMLMGQKQNMGNGRNQPNWNNQFSKQPHPQHQYNYNQQPYSQRQYNQYNQNSSNYNGVPNRNNFVPMKYRNRNNLSQLPPSALSNDGPYSGFR